MTEDQQQLLAMIDAFIGPRGLSESTFGRLAVNDGKFVQRLRGGADFRTATKAKIHEYICRYKQDEAVEAARLAQLVAAGLATKVAA